jgi:F0F1-type ATP synthase assembly protein I
LISAIGAICGLVTLFISEFVFSLFPYTQITVGVRARALVNFEAQELIQFILMAFFYSVLFLWLTTRQINKREGV